MSSFELAFGLTSVILGLALTHLANAARKLMLRGRQVAWAPEPVMQAVVILMLIVTIWMNQFARNKDAFTDGVAFLNVLKMLTLYFAAGFCLPEPEAAESKIDLFQYYDRTRRFSYGSLVAGLATSWIYNITVQPLNWQTDLLEKVFPIACYVVPMFIRWRWLNVLLLLVPIVGVGREIIQASLPH